MSFIKVSEAQCECCDDTFNVYHIPLPPDSVSYNPDDRFTLHLDEDEMRVLYLEIKEHMMGLHDVVPAE